MRDSSALRGGYNIINIIIISFYIFIKYNLFTWQRYLAHNVQIRWIKTESSSWKTVSYQVDPQKLYRDQSFGKTKGGSQEYTIIIKKNSVSCLPFLLSIFDIHIGLSVQTLRLHQYWKKSDNEWTVSCCYRWHGLLQQRRQWKRSYRQLIPSQRQISRQRYQIP